MFWESILIGILSGFIASAIFFIVLFLVRPRLKISNDICKRNTNLNEIIHQIKIVNLTRSMLSNLHYSLQYEVSNGDGTSNVTEIKPSKSCLFYIDKYSRKDKDANYAVRISFDIDETIHKLDNNSCYTFTFYAQHGFSNTTSCIKKKYMKCNIRKGVFETGKSIKIINS